LIKKIVIVKTITIFRLDFNEMCFRKNSSAYGACWSRSLLGRMGGEKVKFGVAGKIFEEKLFILII
jgi:hypothetical protein